MNLADIRKKARQERAVDPDGPGAVKKGAGKIAGHEPVDDFLSTGPGTGEALKQDITVSQELPALATPSSVRRSTPPFEGAREDAVSAFDPLAILLAGRKAAGTVADMIETSSGTSTERGEEQQKYLRFRVDDEEYGVSLLEIREIIKPRSITTVPHMPAFVAGVLSLRGTIIPVLDLRLRLGLVVGEASGGERIIIAKRNGGSCGLLVDEVYQVIGLYDSSLEKAPPVLEGIDREFVRGIGRHGELMLILLDLEKIMDVSLR